LKALSDLNIEKMKANIEKDTTPTITTILKLESPK
jgi:hypothetical protein